MKKVLIGSIAALSLFGGLASTAFADTATTVLPYHRHSQSLQFAQDYARAIATFQIDSRTYLVQANPQTALEIQTKLYWLEKQKVDQMLADLVKTW